MLKLTLFLSAVALSKGFSLTPHYMTTVKTNSLPMLNAKSETIARRDFVASSAALVGFTTTAALIAEPEAALASGGATAGKYTTIPIAKRRYYGRVQQAVHEYLLMGPAVVAGDMNDAGIQTFFDINGVVVVAAKRKDINGSCTKKDRDCKGREIRDSRWNDMKASMYLLGMRSELINRRHLTIFRQLEQPRLSSRKWMPWRSVLLPKSQRNLTRRQLGTMLQALKYWILT